MIINVYLDVSYLFESDACSWACGHFFMGWSAKDGNPIKLNGAFFYLMHHTAICCCICRGSWTQQPILKLQRGHDFLPYIGRIRTPAPNFQVHCENTTAIGVANNSVKRQHLWSMEMRYFWVCDKIAQDAYDVKWHPGQENLADYQSKYHPGVHHHAICLWYLHTKYSPLVLPRATRPSTLKGCVGTCPIQHICNVPLPQVPRVQSAKSSPQVHTITNYYNTTYLDPTYDSLCSLVESAAHAFSPTWHAIAFNS